MRSPPRWTALHAGLGCRPPSWGRDLHPSEERSRRWRWRLGLLPVPGCSAAAGVDPRAVVQALPLVSGRSGRCGSGFTAVGFCRYVVGGAKQGSSGGARCVAVAGHRSWAWAADGAHDPCVLDRAAAGRAAGAWRSLSAASSTTRVCWRGWGVTPTRMSRRSGSGTTPSLKRDAHYHYDMGRVGPAISFMLKHVGGPERPLAARTRVGVAFIGDGLRAMKALAENHYRATDELVTSVSVWARTCARAFDRPTSAGMARARTG